MFRIIRTHQGFQGSCTPLSMQLMDSVGKAPIEMVALGRPFDLGMFYDCRSDKLIPGITFWDKENLDRDMRVRPQPSTEFKIVASESISDKFSSLGVEASLKASFLSGLVEVEGSAKYLNNNKTSSKQARVTLQYKTTTVFKALTMDQLGTGNLEYCEVIDKGLATHVVTAILYGAQAFFVFDQETSEGESVRDIQGNLKVMIKTIPLVSIEGSGDLKMEDKDKETVNKFSCTFHGDFLLEKSPTTFVEAVKVYQNLPKLLGPNGEKAVPVTVYLLPLIALDSKASKLVRQISLRLVTEAENVLEGFTELEMWCNDDLNSPAVHNFSQISKKIKAFRGLCSEFKLGLQETLAQKLPLIRGGGEGETALAELLKKVAESPFSSHRLNQWMEEKDKEVNTIKTLMKLMKNTETVSSGNALTDKVCDSENALVFVLTSLDSTEPFLSELDQYLKGSQSDRSDAPETRHWYSSKDVIDSVRRKAKRFSDFADANKDRDKKSLRFLAVGLADKNHEGSAIYLYEDGFRVSESFEPPSKPKPVTVGEVTDSTVSLHFSVPSEGAHSVTEYRVEFCEKGQEEWNQQTQAEAGAVTVTGLSPDTEYSVRVRAVTAVGVGPAAAPKTSIRTLEPFAPPAVKKMIKNSVKIKSGKPEIYKLSLNEQQLNTPGCRQYVFGEQCQKEDRVILLVGPVGSGKRTVIDAIINYIVGVRWIDSYRFKICEEEETCETVVYKVKHQDGFTIDHSLTIINAPGFGNTRGFERDREITQQIHSLFSNVGVENIHCICFVSSSAQLSPTHHQVLDSAFSIFGKDMAENIRIMVTSADVQVPPVLKAVKAAGVPCPETEDGLPVHFQFNNSALFAPNTSADTCEEMFWDIGNTSMKRFFDDLEQTEAKSLVLTQEVLKEKIKLGKLLNDSERLVKVGLAKLEELKEKREQLKMHEADMERNKNFETSVACVEDRAVSLSGTGTFANICEVCRYTCHYPCSCFLFCTVLDSNGRCRVCPSRCYSKEHSKRQYTVDYRRYWKTNTVPELKQKYEAARDAKISVEAMIKKLEIEYDDKQVEVAELIDKMPAALSRLKEVALLQNTLSVPDHINKLIEAEETEAKPGWQQRLESLRAMKEKAETVAKTN